MVKGPRPISRGTLVRVALRSFWLQANWNFQRMQNVGFCYALYPVVERLWPEPEARLKAIRRHLRFFNTHPYCASIILGVVARLEEEAAQQGDVEAETAERIKVGMMGPLAALGDTVFWAMLKPALALLGVSVVLLAPASIWPAVWGPILFLGLFSIAHLGLRFGGVFVGYARGVDIVKDLRNFNPQLISQRIGLFMAITLGASLGAFLFWKAGVPGGLAGVGLLTGVMGLTLAGLRRGFSSTLLFYLLVAGCLLAAVLGWG